MTIVSLESCVAEYVRRKSAALDHDYIWQLPKSIPFAGFERRQESLAQTTGRLKRFLARMWEANPSERERIANWFVNSWGGIRRNNPETISRYVCTAPLVLAASSANGIATWSKILAVQDPAIFPIFDARVAASLNSLSIIQKSDEPVFFCGLPSRNSQIKEFQKWMKRRFPHSRIVDGQTTYSYYRSLVDAVREPCKLAVDEVEMVLFANAEALIAEARQMDRG